MPTHYLEIGTSILINNLASSLPAPLYSALRPLLDAGLDLARASSKRRTFASGTPPPLDFAKSFKIEGLSPPMPECWGHRGASAAFPENTIASFDRAVRDGSEGIESDVHVTSDDVIVMFHDPSLERTTNGKGLIRKQPWKDCIEHVRTTAKPHQQLPTFRDVCDLLMRPENKHVKLNIDIKPENEPDRLFRLMKAVVQSYPDYASDLGPRLILGLWHPVFLDAALKHVPTMRRIHIGGSPWLATTYFWKHCDGFSMWFPSLVGADGQAFLEAAKRDGKDVFVWTVNRKDEMIEATRWGVKAILTDKTDLLQNVRENMNGDFSAYRRDQVGIFFRWASWRYWSPAQWILTAQWLSQLEKRAGITFKEAWRKAESLEIPSSQDSAAVQPPPLPPAAAQAEAAAAAGDFSSGPAGAQSTDAPSSRPAEGSDDAIGLSSSSSSSSSTDSGTFVGSPTTSGTTTAQGSPVLQAIDEKQGQQQQQQDDSTTTTTKMSTVHTTKQSQRAAVFPVMPASASAC